MELTYSTSELKEAALWVLKHVSKGVVAFEGELGSGKTTLIQSICRQLGNTSAASSPTYSLINEYPLKDGSRIFHFDLYRLKHQSEAIDIGILEYFDSGEWCFIEWPSRIQGLLPGENAVIQIIFVNYELRKLKIIRNEKFERSA